MTPCTSLSSYAGMPSGRNLPFAFGIYVRLTGSGLYWNFFIRSTSRCIFSLAFSSYCTLLACNNYKVEYHHCESLLEALVALKVQDYSKYQKRLKRICGAALLILDDFLLHTITDEREVKILFEILEKRCEISLSTIICSQREPASWSSMILNDEVSANAILKRATKHYTVVIKPGTSA